MSHKTLISGTAYEISGGKTLVNGTAYSIKSGKTLVNGTVYDVGFNVNVTFEGTSSTTNDSSHQITIDGQTYNNADGTVEFSVPVGTLVQCSVMPAPARAARICIGHIDTSGGVPVAVGTNVAEAAKGSTVPATYTHQITQNTKFIALNYIWDDLTLLINEY